MRLFMERSVVDEVLKYIETTILDNATLFAS